MCAYAKGFRTHGISAGSGYEPERGPMALGDLNPGTSYHYGVVVHNGLGRVIAAEGTFTTAAATPPCTNVGLVSNVT